MGASKQLFMEVNQMSDAYQMFQEMERNEFLEWVQEMDKRNVILLSEVCPKCNHKGFVVEDINSAACIHCNHIINK